MSSEKDFMDFIKDAAEDPSRVREFLQALCAQGANEGDLCKLLHDWGYDGVRIKDCATALHASGLEGAWRKEVRSAEQTDY